MKRIIAVALTALLLILNFACSYSAVEEPSTGEDSVDEEVELSSVLTVASEDISSISPYVYESTSGVSSLSYVEIPAEPSETVPVVPIDGQSYLSYMSPDSIGFQPLVFESASGTKVIFEDASLYEIDEGYYICHVNNIVGVKNVPDVHYREIVIDEKTGETVYEPYEMMVEFTNYYGQNDAIFDVANKEIYLLHDSNDWQSGVWVDTAIFDETVISSQNNLYMALRSYADDKSVLYVADKDNLQAGLVPLTNSSVMNYPYLDIASDDLVVFEAQISDGKYYKLVQGSSRESTPARFEPGYFTINWTDETTGVNCSSYEYPSTERMLADGNIIHAFDIFHGNLLVMDYVYTGDEILKGDYKLYPLESDEVYNIELLAMGYVDDAAGIFKLYGDTKTELLRVKCADGNIEIDEVALPSKYDDISSVEISGERVYWADSIFSGQSAICYVDFQTGEVVSRDVMGKTIASPEINVSDDGTVTYWQYMASNEVGTYAWNIDREAEPRLLMTDETDVQQVINIDSL